MSEQQWRILVVEDDEQLNQNTVNSLRKDGYLVQGTKTGAEAIRTLWSQEYDVVIGDLRTPGADGLEMLQWLRTYRPNTRMIMVASTNSPISRTQALEGGVVSYLEKPLNFHLLKEELRRLLQQTGFSANLDSFDLLDVIQIINMSRKSIALLVHIGLEERGILRFQNGELIWAEYGILRGEEAFFALAAHKNGTVTHQHWHDQITPNVSQPLSRLIFQALQYRSKYAPQQQPTGELEAVTVMPATPIPQIAPSLQDDDSPFIVLTEAEDQPFMTTTNQEQQTIAHNRDRNNGNGSNPATSNKEWWEETGKMPRFNARHTNMGLDTHAANGNGTSASSEQPPASPTNTTNIVPSTVRKTPASQRADLPSWLTDQPTKSEMPTLRPSSLSTTAKVPTTPVIKPSPAEWQPPASFSKTTDQLPPKQPTGSQRAIAKNKDTRPKQPSSPEWQPASPEKTHTTSDPLQSSLRRTSEALSFNERQDSGPLTSTGKAGTQPIAKRNYPALVAALQTLGYSIPGFIAAAVVSLDGQPVAQVAIDDLDISPLCKYFSSILLGVLRSLDHDDWGKHEDTIITSTDRHILLRLVSNNHEAFQVLITTRKSEPVESLEVMANVEAAIAAALR